MVSWKGIIRVAVSVGHNALYERTMEPKWIGSPSGSFFDLENVLLEQQCTTLLLVVRLGLELGPRVDACLLLIFGNFSHFG